LGAAVKADGPTVVENIGAGRNVNKADRAESELGGECASNERQTADKATFQNAPETGDAVREHDAIDPKLHIGMIVADMEQAANRGILRNPGRLQQDFFDRLIIALGE
jgi:hypothetical protein